MHTQERVRIEDTLSRHRVSIQFETRQIAVYVLVEASFPIRFASVAADTYMAVQQFRTLDLRYVVRTSKQTRKGPRPRSRPHCQSPVVDCSAMRVDLFVPSNVHTCCKQNQ